MQPSLPKPVWMSLPLSDPQQFALHSRRLKRSRSSAISDDMLGEGLVNSMARPDGNTTGLSILATELDGKRQEILIEAVPGIRRMAALADSNMTKTAAKLHALQDVARARGIELSLHQITTSEEIAAAIDMSKSSGATAINVLASPLLWANRRLIMDRAEALRLPAIYEWPEMAEEGGFAGYGPRLIDVFRDLHARQLVQLLRGIKVADIPVEAADQVRAGDQPQDRQGDGCNSSRSIVGASRQGDRVGDEVIELKLAEVAFGPKLTCQSR